jgi:hypothetical protein
MSKPTAQTMRILLDISEGRGTHHNCHGLSEHGGRSRTLTSLIGRGWIDRDYHITEAGKEAQRLHNLKYNSRS